MRIAMIGSGYVGLVSGACFSEFGHTVTCVDKDPGKIERLQRGEIPIYEPGLDALVAKNVAAGRLSFSLDLAKAIDGAEVVFIAVGTPSRRGDGHADLTYVYAAAEEIAKAMTSYTVVATKSTVPVGTGRQIETILRRVRPDRDFDVCSNPEFLREGSAIDDFMIPNRVVIGAESPRAKAVMKELYNPLYLIETPTVYTTLESAETIKYASNVALAIKISLANQLADFCEKVGANIQDVVKAMGMDQRIGSKFLHAGPGYGGSCFPKDTMAFAHTAREAGAPLSLVETVISYNSQRKKDMAKRIAAAVGSSLQGKTVAILGVTFKPNTDDMRDAPSLDIIPALQAMGANIKAYDPVGMKEAEKLLPKVTWCVNAYSAVQGADVVAFLTEWKEFRALDLTKIKESLNQPIVVDLRNIYKPEDMIAHGFAYYSIGRAPVGVENATQSSLVSKKARKA